MRPNALYPKRSRISFALWKPFLYCLNICFSRCSDVSASQISCLFSTVERTFYPKDSTIVEAGEPGTMFASRWWFIPSILVLSGTLLISENGQEDVLWARPLCDSFFSFSEVLLQLLDPHWKSVVVVDIHNSRRSLYVQHQMWKLSCLPLVFPTPRRSTKSWQIWSVQKSIEAREYCAVRPYSGFSAALPF